MEQPGILGTAIKITAILDINTATSATITIEDPSRVDKVTSADMTKEANKVYSYVYQSTEGDQEGRYVATIYIVYGGYTVIKESSFEMINAFDTTD
ncbi:MAG: hypothetical protein M0R23_08860 [Bacteroidales bacterium]|jgi:hypothetical protein|nr:hypothetical protein [Bacteroidales bacterium]